MKITLLFFCSLILPLSVSAKDCGDMEVLDHDINMCMPLAMADMPMKMIMFHGNGFLVGDHTEGARGRSNLAAPNMEMLEIGSSVGDNHYLNVELMTTFEKWTFPHRGYPELLQVGEEDENHIPFVDAQHPHSSPIMGLTFSDTISLAHEKDHLKLFFAPRGQTTDGPIAFMHRFTGQMVNPDAPLGHHVGQDVGHISSSVVGAALTLNRTTIEASTFHGKEPKPDVVDLPMYVPNSWALRAIQEFSPTTKVMMSLAYVRDTELDTHYWRTSASLYTVQNSGGCRFDNTLLFGMISGHDNTSQLNSFLEEFALTHDKNILWGRIEVLERTADQLFIAADDKPKWVEALTVGYTRKLLNWKENELRVGASLSRDFIPADFKSAYGGDPFTEKVFLQVTGMNMWDI